jgi:hypothetical protein
MSMRTQIQLRIVTDDDCVIIEDESLFACARRSWRDPAGESPVRVGGSARPVASVAGSLVTTAAKRTQQDDEDRIEL